MEASLIKDLLHYRVCLAALNKSHHNQLIKHMLVCVMEYCKQLETFRRVGRFAREQRKTQ